MNIKKSSYFAVLCVACCTWGCQALIKNEPELIKIEQDIIDEALHNYGDVIAK